MKPEHLHILQHSLGVDQYGQGDPYRNHFVTGPGSKDFEFCCELATLGLMVDHGPRQLFGGSHGFQVTEAGKAAMASASPRPPKISRSRRRYLEWLNADCGLSFGEWLKFKQA